MTTRDYEDPQGREIAIARARRNFNNWTSPVVTMRGTAAHQLYSQITWRFYDIFLGIVMTFDAEDPAGHVHCMLSWSRDSENWGWIDSEGGLEALKEFIPAGDQGDFDSHICFAAHLPLRMPDGTSRIYYFGGDGPHSGARKSYFALATTNPDRFAGVVAPSSSSPRDFANATSNRLVSFSGTQIIVTVDVEEGGSFSIGIVDGPENLSRSNPIASSGTDIPVTFPNGATIRQVAGTQGKLIVFLNRAVLYTIGFR